MQLQAVWIQYQWKFYVGLNNLSFDWDWQKSLVALIVGNKCCYYHLYLIYVILIYMIVIRIALKNPPLKKQTLKNQKLF